MSPVPPPDPPEYGPNKPPRAREDTGVGRAPTKDDGIRSAVDSLQVTIDKALQFFYEQSKRTVDNSEVRRSDSTILRQRIEEFLEADTQRREAARKAREAEKQARERRARLLKVLGGVASIVTVIVLGVWEGYKLSRPAPPDPIVTVKETIEERTAKLESEQQTNATRLQAVERKIDQLLVVMQQLQSQGEVAKDVDPEPQTPRTPRPRRPR